MLEKHMTESTHTSKVYEISYLLVPSLPQEKVGAEAAALSALLAQHSATVIDEEAPSSISLAYEMDKSSGGAHQRFDQGYFGWIKFSCPSSSIEDIRKGFEQSPNVLRSLAVSTLKEKTYLGKRAKPEARREEAANPSPAPAIAPGAPLTASEIAAVDQKLDEIVKGA